ncbi:carbamate kinase [bacterium]|nr:carbamate kinase [bacterium]
MSSLSARRAVVAFGGNAISPPDQQADFATQFEYTYRSLGGIVELLKRGYNLAITHGNGPQVGIALRRVELAGKDLPNVPLELLVAETQGSIGYMIEQSLQNRLIREGLIRRVVTLVSQVLVDETDPALSEPTKYIGRIYSHEDAKRYMQEEGWIMKPFNDKDQWRRVVGSPKPLGIVNRTAMRELVQSGVVVIAGGGGGIPVYRDPDIGLKGIDAFVDKDLVAAILAHEIEADELIILTNIDSVRINFGKRSEKVISRMRLNEARKYLDQGHFPPGSMGPKVEAAVKFVEQGGERSIICAVEQVDAAIRGDAGTVILP